MVYFEQLLIISKTATNVTEQCTVATLSVALRSGQLVTNNGRERSRILTHSFALRNSVPVHPLQSERCPSVPPGHGGWKHPELLLLRLRRHLQG